MRSLWIALVCVCVAVPVSAQTVVINPTQVEFTVSADHNATDVFNQPIVTGYEWVATGMNSIGAIVVTAGIVKPAALDGAIVTVPLPGISQVTVNVQYTGTLATQGQEGAKSAPSVPSNPFGVAGPPKVPAKPSNVKVKVG
jgi:hypothetical protein